MTDLRMAAPALAAWVTALACTQVREVPAWASLTLGGLAVVLLTIAPRARAVRTLSSLAVCLAIGAASAAGLSASSLQRSPAVLEDAANSSRVVDLTAVVTGRPHNLDGPGDRVVVDVTVTAAGASSMPSTAAGVSGLSAPAVLFIGGTADLRVGETLGLTARVENGRDGDRQAFVLADAGGTVSRTAPAAVDDLAGGLRAGFVTFSSELPGDGGRLLPGLAVGDTALVDEALSDRMTEASLSHLTAVSGANCALVVGAVLGLLALCGASRRLRVGGSLLALAGFVVLVTPEPSVVRAATMAAIVLVSHGLGRRSLGAPVLCLAVVVCLLVDPWLAREFGFALSVAATAGLLFLAGPLATLLSRFVPRVLAAAIALPLAAQLACQPIIVLLDPSVPVWGVPANMLAAPAAPVVTILGMISCLLLPTLPGLGAVIGTLAWVPSQWVAAVAAATDAAPLARLPGAPGVPGMLAAVGALVLVSVAVGSASARVRRFSASVLIVAFCGYLAVLGGSRIGELVSRPGDWTVAMCDVGQGDAVLVRSGGAVALVDTGPDADALDACLADLGIGHIDLLVLTHFDADHVGGITAVIGRTTQVLHQTPQEKSERAVITTLADGGALVAETAAGDAGDLGGVAWRVLWPPPQPTPYTGNDGSVVIEFGGTIDAILLGDLGADSGLALLAEGTVGSGYAIVKMAHHGSADQYGPLYSRIGARLALVSSGADNDYGHPTASALALLTRDGTAVARSDRSGTTLVATREDELVTWSSGPADGGLRATG
ncbi:ComEC/Rec2 family competence protein [Labedella endophytica]|uniref:MBL fold metallo-hydrolase n=1 Tax=Labedella endophytica TaxID=1523160 RepID=A0A3S0WUV0_9MICO|nr:ComEC/Rec2 family competence protein [Labedella endophytica]RUQ97159.1 MBL fold metallo-hydrolase [Labedella endophytica]